MFGESDDWFFAPDEKESHSTTPLGTGQRRSFRPNSLVGCWKQKLMTSRVKGQIKLHVNLHPILDQRRVVLFTRSEGKYKFPVPNEADYVKLTITPGDKNKFHVRIENISAKASVPTPLSPGSTSSIRRMPPLFTSGKAAGTQGWKRKRKTATPGSFVATLGTTDKQAHVSPGIFCHSQRSGSNLYRRPTRPGPGIRRTRRRMAIHQVEPRVSNPMVR